MEFFMAKFSNSDSSFDSSTSSSSESSSESDHDLDAKVAREKHVKSKCFVENVVSQLSDIDFRSHFRLTRTSVEDLVVTLKENKVDIVGRPAVPFLKCLLMTLWLLATEESFRSVGDRFSLSKGHAHSIFIKTCQIISKEVTTYIKWPLGESAISTVANFNELRGERSFPNVIGCIDGTHIAIPGPLGDNSYYNRKGYHSMILQAVCNSKQEFTDIYFGWPGSVNDARVWQNSPLYNDINNLNMLPLNTYLLGDSAYPLNKFIMVPFRDNGHLTRKRCLFNQRLSSTRVVIEQAFGRLKGMFRRLKYLHVNNLKYCKYIVFAACILHNVCLKDPHNQADMMMNSDINDDKDNDNYQNCPFDQGGIELRDRIMNMLS